MATSYSVVSKQLELDTAKAKAHIRTRRIKIAADTQPTEAEFRITKDELRQRQENSRSGIFTPAFSTRSKITNEPLIEAEEKESNEEATTENTTPQPQPSHRCAIL